MKIGDKFVKDGKVIEVFNIKDNYFDDGSTSNVECVWFWCEKGSIHVITERDFLEQYTPYEPVYEWQWAYTTSETINWGTTAHMTEEEFKTWQGKAPSSLEYHRLEFTKRERQCIS